MSHSTETKEKIKKSLQEYVEHKGPIRPNNEENFIPVKDRPEYYRLNPKACLICGNPVPYTSNYKRKTTCNNDCSIKLKAKTFKEKREKGLTKPLGGQREGSGRSNPGWYRGIYCGSTYELAFLIYYSDRGKKVNRCTESFPYLFNGGIKKYFPDFIVDDTIYEIKGYMDEKAIEKAKQHPTIKVVNKKEIKVMIDYVRSTYKVKSLTELYDRPA